MSLDETATHGWVLDLVLQERRQMVQYINMLQSRIERLEMRLGDKPDQWIIERQIAKVLE